jgi:hypothetical protein
MALRRFGITVFLGAHDAVEDLTNYLLAGLVKKGLFVSSLNGAVLLRQTNHHNLAFVCSVALDAEGDSSLAVHAAVLELLGERKIAAYGIVVFELLGLVTLSCGAAASAPVSLLN